MKSFILRIYRGHENPGEILSGTIEEVDGPEKTSFGGFEELRSFLEGGASGGRKRKQKVSKDPEKEVGK